MTHGRKPRRTRWSPYVDTMATAKARVALVVPQDRQSIITPLQAAFTALRQGVGGEWDWAQVCSAINAAMAIEKQGGVKGLRGHLHAAELALQAISQRAMANGHWQATELFLQEIDDITEAIRLHKFQLKQLSTGELNKALDYAQAEVRSSGGRVLQAQAQTQASLLN